MKISVWDTYVKRKDGRIMHFDILVETNQTNPDIIYSFGKKYLASKNEIDAELTSNQCRFCHIAAAPQAVKDQVEMHGFAILEMENCD